MPSYKVQEFINPVVSSWDLKDEIYIWKFPVKKMTFTFLSVHEREISGRFRLEEDANRFLMGRHSLRLLLSHYLSLKPESISVATERGQKPFVLNPKTSLQFNISHSGAWILIAIANKEVGVDIEQFKAGFKFENLLSDHFSETELELIKQVENREGAFYYLWTRKEALTKAWGTGLQENLKMISVEDESRTYEMQGKIWNLKSFNITPDYPAAVAYEGAEKTISFYDGSSLLV